MESTSSIVPATTSAHDTAWHHRKRVQLFLLSVLRNNRTAPLLFLIFTVVLGPACATRNAINKPYIQRLAPDGKIHVINVGTGDISVINPFTLQVEKKIKYHGFDTLNGLDIDRKGRILVTSITEGDIVFEGDIFRGAAFLFEPASGEWKKFGEWNGSTGLKYPMGACFGPDGSIIVADAGTNQLVVFSPSLEQVSRIGELGTAETSFFNPSDVKMSPDGNIWTLECYGSRIKLYDRNFRLLKCYPPSGFDRTKLLFPENMTFDEAGFAYITDLGNQRVIKLTKDLELAGIIPVHLPEKDRRRHPGCDSIFMSGLTVLGNSELAISDTTGSRILVFDMEGNFKRSLDEDGCVSP